MFWVQGLAVTEDAEPADVGFWSPEKSWDLGFKDLRVEGLGL